MEGPRSTAAQLWALTTYFNPFDEPRRVENFRRFRAALGVPLVAVELAFGDRFDLKPGDADILIQLNGGDVMWQKERLLNLALAALPASCTRVAWLDCDVVFADEDWASRASDLLDRYAVIQLFETVHYLRRDDREPGPRAGQFNRLSLPAMLARGGAETSVMDTALVGPVAPYASGLAMAARREVIADVGFYDRCVIGGGDRALISAVVGAFDHPPRYAHWNSRQKTHYLAWAESLHRAAAGSIGYLPTDAFHLWHGDLETRSYRKRHEGFSAFGFDPAADIALTDNGVWRWATDKPAMHDYVRNYFRMRRDAAAG